MICFKCVSLQKNVTREAPRCQTTKKCLAGLVPRLLEGCIRRPRRDAIWFGGVETDPLFGRNTVCLCPSCINDFRA